MVLAHGCQFRERSVLSLFSVECRQLALAARVSGLPRAVLHFTNAEPDLDCRLRSNGVAHRRSLVAPLPFEAQRRLSTASRDGWRRQTDAEPAPAMVAAG